MAEVMKFPHQSPKQVKLYLSEARTEQTDP